MARLILLARRGVNCFLCSVYRTQFRRCGKNVKFDAFGQYSFSTISIGDDVYIGKGAKMSARHTTITIGNKCMFGPNVTIRGGNHNTSVIGRYMADVLEKRPEDDQPVVVDDDVWVGTGAIILKGVTIGRGAIVAAGAVVTKNVEPYSIVGGVPARRLRYRWTAEQIREHERQLYPPEKWLSEADLPDHGPEESAQSPQTPE